MAEHTELRIKPAVRPVDGERDCAIVANINGGPKVVAECFGRLSEDTTQDAVELADRFVNAVNSHADLVEALEPWAEHAKERAADAPEWNDNDTVQIVVRISELRAVVRALTKAGETEMAEHTELRECPFCGGEAKLMIGGSTNAFIECRSCRASSDDASTERTAAKWNTRAPDPSHADLVEALEAAHVVIDMLGKQLGELDAKCSPLEALQFVQARELRDAALTKAGER